MRTKAAAIVVVTWSALVAGCYKAPPQALTLNGNQLTIDNRTKTEWSNVEVWLNTHYRVTAKSSPPGGRVLVPLDMFVAGMGQRFNYNRMQVRDLRLNAKLPDGTPLELQKEFEVDGLAALGAVGKKTDKKK